MTRLVVAGCSVSDYTEVDKPWGEYLSEQLSCEYLHLAGASGSNYRMWRLLVSHVVDNKITADDTVIVQYTNPERNEFWSPRPMEQLGGAGENYHGESGGTPDRPHPGGGCLPAARPLNAARPLHGPLTGECCP